MSKLNSMKSSEGFCSVQHQRKRIRNKLRRKGLKAIMSYASIYLGIIALYVLILKDTIYSFSLEGFAEDLAITILFCIIVVFLMYFIKQLLNPLLWVSSKIKEILCRLNHRTRIQ